MSRRVVPRLTRRIAIALTLCTALLPTHHMWLLATEAAQGRPEEPEQNARPKPGKPEGMLPNLEEVRAYTPVASGSGEAWTFWSYSEKSVQRIANVYLRYTNGTPKIDRTSHTWVSSYCYSRDYTRRT